VAHLELVTTVAAPAELVFDLSCDIGTHVGSMAASGERAVAGRTSGLIGLGEQVTWEARHFGVRWRMTSVISAHERPHRFVDEMVSGPFARWCHEHRFTPERGGTRMVDVVDYAAPAGPLGRLVDALVLRRYMRRLLQRRNEHIRRLAEAAQAPGR
jgi:ligand-binding SRPBCC domain-containing protein